MDKPETIKSIDEKRRELLNKIEDIPEFNPIPEEEPEKSFRFNSRCVLLTYKTHIDKKVIVSFFSDRSKISREFKELYIAHESGKDDPKTPYLHTHVAVKFNAPGFQSIKARIFDINDIHPHIKPISLNQKNLWRNVVRYLGKEDPDNEVLITYEDGLANLVWSKQTLCDALQLASSYTDVSGIVSLYQYKPSEIDCNMPELHQWQTDLLTETEGIPNDRSIIWYYDKPGSGGKTRFGRYLMTLDPKKYYYVNACGGNYHFSTVIDNALKSGWESHTMFINLVRSDEDKSFYGPIEALKDGITTTLKYNGHTTLYNVPNVIVFANFLPEINRLSKDRWRIRQLICPDLIRDTGVGRLNLLKSGRLNIICRPLTLRDSETLRLSELDNRGTDVDREIRKLKTTTFDDESNSEPKRITVPLETVKKEALRRVKVLAEHDKVNLRNHGLDKYIDTSSDDDDDVLSDMSGLRLEEENSDIEDTDILVSKQPKSETKKRLAKQSKKPNKFAKLSTKRKE